MSRCVYCGHKCSRQAKACRFHRDLYARDYPEARGRWSIDEELAAELRDVKEQQRDRYAYKTHREANHGETGAAAGAEEGGPDAVLTTPSDGSGSL